MRVERRLIRDFVIVGAVMTAIPFVLFALAEQRVSSVLAGLVNATTPLFTAVFVALLLPAERPDRLQVGGLVLGFGGIAVLLGVWDSGAIDLVGGVMLLGATFCYGLGNAWSRRRLTSTGLSNVALPAIQLAVGALLILPFAVSTPLAGPMAPAPALALLALGLGGTGLAYVLFWRVLAIAGATVTASVTYVIPLVSDDPRRARAARGPALVRAGRRRRGPRRRRADAVGGCPPSGGRGARRRRTRRGAPARVRPTTRAAADGGTRAARRPSRVDAVEPGADAGAGEPSTLGG